MVADIELEPEAREPQVGADERICKVQGREIELFSGEVLRPGLIECDDERRRRVELPHNGNRFGGELQPRLFTESERVTMSHTRRDLPKMNFTTITFDHRANVLQHKREQAIEIAFPQIGPIGNATVIELQQRPGANPKAG